MAEIYVQRRRSDAWLWLIAIIGMVLLLWAVIRGSDPETRLLGSPRVFLIGDPQEVALRRGGLSAAAPFFQWR